MKQASSIFKQRHYLTDGGLETTLIFHEGILLNHFAAFELLRNEEGKTALREYYEPYLALADRFKRGHGNSSKPRSGYQTKDFAKDVSEFIKEKKLGACIITI